MKIFPTLYKKNTQGKIESWSIYVNNFDLKKPQIDLNYGEFRGKKINKSQTITEGKNIGKKNETSIIGQAYAEAEAKWQKQLKKGYVKSVEDAMAGKTDEIIQGGILPMLAHKYKDHKEKIKFPVMVQPKLDGERCIAIKQDGEITLWTRTRKPITSCPHIIEDLEVLLVAEDNLFLDGELYFHSKDNFEKIMSAVRKQKPSEESKLIEYHIYDCGILDDIAQPFEVRKEFLADVFEGEFYLQALQLTITTTCDSHERLENMQKYFIANGYEGLIIRDPESFYECGKRSKGLLKMKTFDDAEFRTIGVRAGEDKSVIFVCLTKEGTAFEVTMTGNKDNNQKYLSNEKLWKNKQLTVKYFGLTGKNKVPRHAQGIKFRSDL